MYLFYLKFFYVINYFYHHISDIHVEVYDGLFVNYHIYNKYNYQILIFHLY